MNIFNEAFFEVGFVLLVPLAFVISKRMDTPILRVGLPMLAGLSIAHALVPPHPAPTLAVATFHADAGKTILYAILVGIPTGILAGPLFANFAARWVHSGTSAGALFPGPESTEEETNRAEGRSRPFNRDQGTTKSINDHGEITGSNSTNFTEISDSDTRLYYSNGVHAILYTAGLLRDLGTLPGTSRSIGVSINNSGEIVGTCGTAEVSIITAFLYMGRRDV